MPPSAKSLLPIAVVVNFMALSLVVALAIAGNATIANCAVSAWILSLEHSSPETPLTPESIMTVGVPPDRWPCPASKEQSDALYDAVEKRNAAGYRHALVNGVMLEPGTKVRQLVEDPPHLSVYHLVILSGPNAGRECYAAMALGFIVGH